jgi:hypothetical protein
VTSFHRIVSIAAAVTAAMVWVQPAAAQGGSAVGQWIKRIPIKPDPSKVVVPPGYKVGVFKAGLDTPASATVDKDGNLWVTISGVLLGSPEADEIEKPHVKIFDRNGNLLREVGKVIDIESRSASVSLPWPVARAWFYSIPLAASCLSMLATCAYLLLVDIAMLAGAKGVSTTGIMDLQPSPNVQV